MATVLFITTPSAFVSIRKKSRSKNISILASAWGEVAIGGNQWQSVGISLQSVGVSGNQPAISISISIGICLGRWIL